MSVVIPTLANHKEYGEPNEPIKTRSKNMYLTQSAGKLVRTSPDWLWFRLAEVTGGLDTILELLVTDYSCILLLLCFLFVI